MKEKKITQRCKDDKVSGTGNWENYMWPHQLDKTAPPPPPRQSSGQSISMMHCNNVGGNLIGSFNGASIGGGSQITINK